MLFGIGRLEYVLVSLVIIQMGIHVLHVLLEVSNPVLVIILARNAFLGFFKAVLRQLSPVLLATPELIRINRVNRFVPSVKRGLILLLCRELHHLSVLTVRKIRFLKRSER